MSEYVVIVEYDPDSGSYGASSPDLPVDGIGKSSEEAIARFHNALQGYLEFQKEMGLPIPDVRHTVTTVRV